MRNAWLEDTQAGIKIAGRNMYNLRYADDTTLMAESEEELKSLLMKNWLNGKDPDAGKDRWQEEKGMTEDEMVGWHHRLNGHEFEQSLEDGEG